jgi:hypothetical protein
MPWNMIGLHSATNKGEIQQGFDGKNLGIVQDFLKRGLDMTKKETDKRLSRGKGVQLPKVVESDKEKINSTPDMFATSQAFATARNQKFDKEKEQEKAEARDAEWERVCKIPDSSSDLIVITKTKKLGAYIVAVTQKSPAKFRSVFVNRMHNLCLDALQDMFRANFIRQDCIENKKQREQYQTDAIIKLKMLGYIALLAENSGCILTRQLKQISIQVGEVVNLATAWKKSDDKKWREKQES